MATKILTPINLGGNELQNATIQNLAIAPSSPKVGQVYYDTAKGQFGVFTSSGWIYLTSGSGANVSQAGNSTASGIMKVSGGANTSITDYSGGTGLLKSSASGVVSPAVAGTDYLSPTGSGAGLTGLTQSQISGLTAALAALAPLSSPTFTGTVTVPTPVNATDAVTKAYADATTQGLSPKASVRVATTGAETYTISAGSVTQITGTTVDGVTPAVGNRILIKDAPSASGAGSANSTQPGNGIYSVTSNTTNLSVSRVADLSGSNGPAGAYTLVEAGSANASAGFVVSNPSSSVAFTYGTTSMAWTQFSGAGEITAGTGLTKSGNTVSLSTPVSLANGGTGGGSQSAAKSSLGFAGVYNSAAIGDGSSTTLTVTHNLNNAIPMVQVYDVSGTPALVMCDVAATSANVVTLTFGTAPASSSIKCVVVG